MIVAAFNPETTDLERTYLSQYSAEGSATLQVKNTDTFATNKAILIGKMGGERSELMATDGVTPHILCRSMASQASLTTQTIQFT
jgi:hypothetical protein